MTFDYVMIISSVAFDFVGRLCRVSFVGVWCAIGEPVYRIRGMDLWTTLAFSASLDGFDSRLVHVPCSIVHQPFLFFLTSFKISLTGIGPSVRCFFIFIFYYSIVHTELVHEIPIVYSHLQNSVLCPYFQ